MTIYIRGEAERQRGGRIEHGIGVNLDGLYLRIFRATNAEGEESGTTYERDPIPFATLLPYIDEAARRGGGNFSRDEVEGGPLGENTNNPDFVVPILIDINFVEEEGGGRYRFRTREILPPVDG